MGSALYGALTNAAQRARANSETLQNALQSMPTTRITMHPTAYGILLTDGWNSAAPVGLTWNQIMQPRKAPPPKSVRMRLAGPSVPVLHPVGWNKRKTPSPPKKMSRSPSPALSRTSPKAPPLPNLGTNFNFVLHDSFSPGKSQRKNSQRKNSVNLNAVTRRGSVGSLNSLNLNAVLNLLVKNAAFMPRGSK